MESETIYQSGTTYMVKMNLARSSVGVEEFPISLFIV